MMVVARLATSAAPIPVRHHSTFFELPHKKRRQRRLLEEEQRQKALLEAEEESRSLAWNYIVDFLQASEWSDQMDQITVVCEAVPTMEELESYGFLDEKEGTRASRKLFKAPVVWDDLGHGLWKVLSAAAAEQRRQRQLQQSVIVEEPARPVCWNGSFGGHAELSHSVGSSRRSSSRRTSEDSCSTCISHDSSQRMSLSSSPDRRGSIPRIFSRIASRRCNS